MFDHYDKPKSAFDIGIMGLNKSGEKIVKKIVKVTKKGDELISYLDFFGSRAVPFRELLGKHRVTSGPVTKGLTVGRWDPQSKTWKDGVTDYKVSVIEYFFPRSTLARLLKQYVNAGLVEKISEPREKGKRGRQAYQYNRPSVTRVCYAMRFKDAYFFGFVKHRNKKPFIQLYPRDKRIRDALCNERTEDGSLLHPDLAKAVKQDQSRRKHGLGRDERWAALNDL